MRKFLVSVVCLILLISITAEYNNWNGYIVRNLEYHDVYPLTTQAKPRLEGSNVINFLQKIKAVKNMVRSIKMLLAELGDYGGSLAIVAYTILLERLKRQSTIQEVDWLYKYAIEFINK